MSRANTVTLLPLDRFAQIVGYNPLHFNQVEVVDLAQIATCEVPVVQHAWQASDRLGREEIAQAIADAERMIAQQTGFKLLPSWELYEEQSFSRPALPELFNLYASDIRGFPQSVKTNWRYVIQGGRRAVSLIMDEANVNFGDDDGDGYSEIASIVVATTVTNPEEIAIFYPHKGGDDKYQIRPITVVINGGVATITCRREQLVNLDLMEALSVRGVNGLDDANFLSTVDVYRKYNDTTTQGIMIWLNPNNTCNCGTCEACVLSSQDTCISVRDSKLGRIVLHPWDGTNYVAYSLGRAPDKVRLYYRAGWVYNESMISMDPMWERAVSYLAAALLDRPLCSCTRMSAFNEYWRVDLASVAASRTGTMSYRIPAKEFSNPFGTTRGALYAWSYAKQFLGDA